LRKGYRSFAGTASERLLGLRFGEGLRGRRVRVANECVPIHGAYRFIKDYPAERFYRDVKLCAITHCDCAAMVGEEMARSLKRRTRLV
jgi:hypothetical protein